MLPPLMNLKALLIGLRMRAAVVRSVDPHAGPPSGELESTVVHVV